MVKLRDFQFMSFGWPFQIWCLNINGFFLSAVFYDLKIAEEKIFHRYYAICQIEEYMSWSDTVILHFTGRHVISTCHPGSQMQLLFSHLPCSPQRISLKWHLRDKITTDAVLNCSDCFSLCNINFCWIRFVFENIKLHFNQPWKCDAWFLMIGVGQNKITTKN